MADHANRGFRRLFGGDGLTVGLFFPITTSTEAIPPMDEQVELARYAVDLGFDALWFRDVPLFWPKFGDAGQVHDPWVYLAHVAAHTEDVALATGSVVLPLRHPLHVAKAAASVDRLSDGRLVLGVASGDRPPEYEAFGVDEQRRGELFRESVRTMRAVWSEEFPEVSSSFGTLSGSLDAVPKPTTETLPLLVTGHSRQSLDWIATHGDGWLYYQLPLDTLDGVVADWREATDGRKPFVEATTVNLAADPGAGMTPVHQGYEAGSEWFRDHVAALEDRGVDHLAINVRGSDRDAKTVLREFASEVVDEL
ncbi:MAG: LLM class oxidoreductase [Haloferacaceae archaeon]